MRRKPRLQLFTLLLLPLVLSVSAVIVAAEESERGIYLVLLEGDPIAFHSPEGTSDLNTTSVRRDSAAEARSKLLVESHDRLLEANLDAGGYHKLYSFRHVINGFAVHTTPSQAKRLEAADGVALVERDGGVRLATTYTPSYLGLPRGLWAGHGGAEGAGEGVVVGFVDTGIDPAHPSFAYRPDGEDRDLRRNKGRFSGACEVGRNFPPGSCNGKIVSARHFWAGAAAVLPIGDPAELSPIDEVGHGTHVASIAAGNSRVPVVVNGFNYGYASGMAPGARIAVYKALYPQGGTVADVVSAIDQAIRDGIDVLSLSIGPDNPPSERPIFLSIFDITLLNVRRAGIFVAEAAGNKGPGRATLASFSPWSLTVAASTTNREYNALLVLDGNKKINGVGLTGPTFWNGQVPVRLVAAKDATASTWNGSATPHYAEECQHKEALDPSVVRGSIVICNYSSGFLNGVSTITTILSTAEALGFMGFVLVANPSYGSLIAEPIPFPVPGVIVPRVEDVKILMDYYENRTVREYPTGSVTRYGARAAITEGRVASFEDDPPAVARFSSRGPDIIDNLMNPADVLKPDVLAPGHQIWGAWSPISIHDPIYKGCNFALLSGTSMAAPHVAGIAAIVKKHRPTWNPSMTASGMSTTAKKFDEKGRPIMAQGAELYSLLQATPFDYGAGLVNPQKTLDPGLVFSSVFDDYIAFLCSLPNIDVSKVQKATGRGCDVFLTSPTDLNLPSVTISSLNGSRVVRRRATSVAGEPEIYVVSVQPPPGLKVDIQPSWFTIPANGTQDLIITFTAVETLKDFSFGEIVMTGSLDHIVRLPLAIFPISLL